MRWTKQHPGRYFEKKAGISRRDVLQDMPVQSWFGSSLGRAWPTEQARLRSMSLLVKRQVSPRLNRHEVPLDAVRDFADSQQFGAFLDDVIIEQSFCVSH